MNIVFLDIFGILKDLDSSEIYSNKIILLKELVDCSDSKVIITSPISNVENYELLIDCLNDLGISIIDYNHNDIECLKYINECLIKYIISDFAIIDENFNTEYFGYYVKYNFDLNELNEEEKKNTEYVLERG